MKTTTNGSSRTSEPFVNRMRNASTTTKNNAKRPTGNDSMNILEYIMPRIRSIAFVDFTKAFDCITLELLFLALGKAWMPCSALSKFKLSGHSILKCTQDCIDGELANPIEYNSGVKQRCKLAPTLFGMYGAGMLYLAFKDMDSFYSIKVRFRHDDELFDLRRLESKTKLFTKYKRKAQYADDIATFIDDGTALQCLLSAYSNLSLKMDLRININKTETMSVGEQLDFFIDGHKLRRVDRFKYFGSYVTKFLIRNRLLWMGHVALMPDERPVKALLYGVLVLLLKDILKRGAALGTWREIVTGRLARWRLASDICDKIEQEYGEESQA